VPVSAADPLAWNQEAIPGIGGNVLGPAGVDITDLAVSSDGSTIWAVPGAVPGLSATVYKSTNGGATWSAVSTTAGGQAAANATLVAIAPDDSNIVALCTTGLAIYVSTNGGVTWGSLGIPGATLGSAATAINDIDISAASPTNHVLVAGVDTTNADAEMWYQGLGVGGAWVATGALGSGPASGITASTNCSSVLAVKASPNFASDLVITAVTVNATNSGTFFNMFSRNAGPQGAWNTSAWPGTAYPVNLQNGAGNITATAACIALAPTYLGGDEVERVGFVGITSATAADQGIYRLKDTNASHITAAADMYSLAYDGATLVAGTTGTTVWRSPDALNTSPNFYPTSTAKSPGGATNVSVAWAGSTLVAGTVGNESAFAVSTDDGGSFNDISLIDTNITTMYDVAVSPDGSVVYLSTQDAAAAGGPDVSIWRYDGSWARVLSLTGQQNYILRLAPEEPDALYVAASATSNTTNSLYYTKTGGNTKWYSRTLPGACTDVAVESESVAYASAGTNVQKTTNGGFTWGPPTNTELTGVYSLTSLGEDTLIAGGTADGVAYSTNGGMPLPGYRSR
jgi:hypothetical protein